MSESNITLFALGDSAVATGITSRLNIKLGTMRSGFFSNKETKLEIETSVRNKDVYVLQVMDGEPNDCLMQLMMMCYALKTACCRKVIGIMPYLPYSKQSKMRNRGSIAAKLMAQLLGRAGLDHMLTMDLHSKEVQGFYECPVDNLRASPFLIQYIQERIPGYQHAVIVARHPGAASRANSFAERLQLNIAVLHGQHVEEDSDRCDGRQSPPLGYSGRMSRSRGTSESLSTDFFPPEARNRQQASLEGGYYNVVNPYLGMPSKVKKPLTIVGDVCGKIAIIVDDIIDDASAMVDAATILSAGGATKIYVIATHGLFSGNAPQVIEDSKIDEIIVTNTVPVNANKLHTCTKIRTVDISPLLSEAVRRIHNGESMSYLFRNIPLED